MARLRRKSIVLWLGLWLPVAAWAAVIFIVSSRPSLPLVDGGRGLPVSQVGHVVEYAVLALLLFRALSRQAPAASLVKVALVSLALSLLYGVSDELHQTLVSQRQPSLGDVALDGLGAAVTLPAAIWLRRLRGPG